MKELKALEILRESLQWNESAYSGDNDGVLSHINKMKEAIAELETLQAPKTCETCRQKHHDGFCDIVFNAQLFNNTDKTVAVYIEAMNGFSCSYYEPKEYTQC